MKQTLLTLVLSLIGILTANAQVGIGTTSPDASAQLELQSTDKGFLPPRMDSDARNNINSPAEGLMIYNTDEKCLQWYDTNGWYDGCSGATYGVITSLDCANATNNGTLTNGQTAADVDSEIAYTGGNGQSYSGQVVTSNGVTGLTATLSAGNFATGAESLTYTITGTPASDGTASFAISIGGQTCSLERTVVPPGPCVGVIAPSGYGLVESGGKCWLDRNLGASQVALNSTDEDSYGDLYQWGRGADGHEKIFRVTGDAQTSGTTAGYSTSSSPGPDFLTGYDNWYSGSNPNDLWKEDGTGVNNPCPTGFRLPTVTDWNDEIQTWGTNDKNAAGALASPLKLPMPGYRNGSSGGLMKVGSNGFYWSSSVSGTNAERLYFTSSSAFLGGNPRANGLSVRCIKE